MATQYDLSNYTPGVVPAQYSRDIKQFCLLAVSMGWKLHITSGSAMRLVSPKGEKVIQLNMSKKSHPLQQYRRWVQQYANPLLVPTGKSDKAIEAKASQIIHSMEVRENTEAAKVKTDPIVDKVVEKLYGDDEPDPATKVVYEGPMRSRRGGSGGAPLRYESDIATEIEYGDGRRVLTCVRCDFSADKPLKMSGHWQKHVNEDKAAKGLHTGPKAVPLASTSEYHPRAERLESLKEALIEAMGTEINWGDIDGAAEILARKALEWDHNRRMEHGEPTELTPEQLLDRIRNLVDGGKYAERLEEIRALREEVSEQEATIVAVSAERDKAREYVSTLRELLNEEA